LLPDNGGTLALTSDLPLLATTSANGLLKILSDVATEYMNGTGNWSTPPNDNDNDIDYVSNVTYDTGVITFTGIGNAFNSDVDISAVNT